MLARKFTPCFFLLLSGALGLSMAGCGGGNNSLGPGGNTTAQVREVNALVGASGSVNLVLRTPTATPLNAAPLPFGETSGQVESQSLGHYDTIGAVDNVNEYVVVANGATPTANGQNTIGISRMYTMIAYGVVGQTGTFIPQFGQFPDALFSLSANNAAIRVINVAPTTTAAYQNIALYNGSTSISGAASYGTSSGYSQVGAGTVTLTLKNAQSPQSALATTGSSLNNMPLAAGKFYTVIVLGVDTAAPSTYNAIVLQDN